MIASGASVVSHIVAEGSNVITNSTPFTWATNDILVISGLYEAA